jgi:hypothetical protein
MLENVSVLREKHSSRIVVRTASGDLDELKFIYAKKRKLHKQYSVQILTLYPQHDMIVLAEKTECRPRYYFRCFFLLARHLCTFSF